MTQADVYLWKEWREQRATLGVLAVMLLLAAGVVASVVPAHFLDDPILVAWVVAMTVLATLLSVGSDLLPRERQAGTMRFLERLPKGLGRAFRSKLTIFALALVGAVVYGGLLAALASLVRTGHLPEGVLGAATIEPPLAVLGLALWVFAVSAWIPNSALALPAAALLIAGLGWPIWPAMTSDFFRPTVGEGRAFLVLTSAGALASAWAAAVFGSRLGRSRRVAALAGIVVGAVAFAPSWIWAGARYVKLSTAPFTIETGMVGAGASRAFLTLTRRPLRNLFTLEEKRYTAIVVDLEDGGWRCAGDWDASFVAEDPDSARLLHSGDGTYARLRLYDIDLSPLPGSSRMLDGVTGLEIPIESQTALPQLAPQPGDFGLEDLTSRYFIKWAGNGYVLRWWDEERIRHCVHLDPKTGRAVELAELVPEFTRAAWADARVGSSRWLLQRGLGWVWVDPETGVTEPVAWLVVGDQLGPSLEDGRVLLLRDGRMSLLDPETGERSIVRIVGAESTFIHHVNSAIHGEHPLRVDEPTIVNVFTREWRGLALLDPVAGTLRRASESTAAFQIAATDGASAIAVDGGRRLVRHDFRTGVTEELFSVDDIE
ncbi:MAG: hypothetical protein E2O39_04135 [Planctomycetota bacterium]|nr:MAG: hypothetical protein E2O39_04135 [Planctomycetota bacterium]